MKKALLFVILTLIGIGEASAQSSSNTAFGVLGAVNLASIGGDDTDGLDGRTGLRIGGVANIGISELFAVQPEVTYSMRGFSDGEVKVKIDYIDFPVLADFEVIDGLSLQGGPQLGINLSAKVTDGEDEADIEDISTLNVGAAIGAQYELPVGVFFQVRYDMALNDVIDNGFDAKNRNLTFGVGFFFK